MSYLKLIQDKMQNLSEAVASVLNIEVAIVDNNLIRVVGTGNFHEKIDESCAEDSIFARVIDTGEAIVNLNRDKHCYECSNFQNCSEFANMSYPIKGNDGTLGLVSFASFDFEQANIMRLKKEEYFNMLRETAGIVEQEIINVKMTNKLNRDTAEVDEIINSLNKGIIILNSDNKIIHINVKALDILKISISTDKVIEKDIEKFISNIELKETRDMDTLGCWNIKGKDVKVIYDINKIAISDYETSLMISFNVMSDIINIVKTYGDHRKIHFSDIVGESKSIMEVIEKSKVVAGTDSTVLIQGDSGTGKELFARSIHNESSRKDGNFVAVNCASIPESLIESELFGYEKGAFTGANTAGKKGKLELANNGTLFLDEIGELPVYLQTKLLRVLQERTIDRVGGDKPIGINIRIISATNKNLAKLVKEGKFRLDLYYRLNVIPINLPALRDREDDVFLCSKNIIKNLCEKMNKDLKELDEGVKKLFKNYSWPGNIRELENVLEHGICFAKDRYIRLDDLPDYFLNKTMDIEKLDNNRKYKLEENKSLEELKNEFERETIQALIDEFGDTVEGKKLIAEKLNIGMTTLYRKLNSY